ncbi:hypothetical protein K0M31_008047 [Melipona bicolor]|uniref:Uncharacterized protein n=1 Tax=Melipona bicolor TaxID=60889 RepID=A0AA40GCJ7_9HYME|nr:hypothetical protein K0M31_008047 [Melipona bicolor]
MVDRCDPWDFQVRIIPILNIEEEETDWRARTSLRTISARRFGKIENNHCLDPTGEASAWLAKSDTSLSIIARLRSFQAFAHFLRRNFATIEKRTVSEGGTFPPSITYPARKPSSHPRTILDVFSEENGCNWCQPCHKERCVGSINQAWHHCSGQYHRGCFGIAP